MPKTLEYFNDENQYNNNSHYPNEKRIKHDLSVFEKRFNGYGVKGVIELRKTWSYDIKDTIPNIDEIISKINNGWIKFRNGQIEFLESFLEKYKN